MSEERIIELRELIFGLERRIKPLEWDASRNQINEFKKTTLARLQEEHKTFVEELNGLENKD